MEQSHHFCLLFLDLDICIEYRPFSLYNVIQFGFAWHIFMVKPRLELSPALSLVYLSNIAETMRHLSPSGLLLPRGAQSYTTFKKHVHTAPSNRCWIKLERASSPSQNWHLKYRHLLTKKQKSMYWSKNMNSAEGSKTTLLVTHKTCNRTVTWWQKKMLPMGDEK